MSLSSLHSINSIRAYDDPLFLRLKERYLKKNHGKQIIQRTPLSLRRAMLVQAAYGKLQGMVGDGNIVTLNVLEKFHPKIQFHNLDTIKHCTNTAVREVLLDFLSAQGANEIITKEAFTKYYECMSFYVSQESSFERHMMTVYALSPVDVVTMASRRLDESIAASHSRTSFSSTGSVRSLTESYSSDRENEQQFVMGVNNSSPAMPTPPRTNKRASSTHSLRSKSFTEPAASSASTNKEVKVAVTPDSTDSVIVDNSNGNGGIGIAGMDVHHRNKSSLHRSFDSSQRVVGDGIDDGGLRALMDDVYQNGNGRRISGGRSKTAGDSPTSQRRPFVITTTTTASPSSSSSSMVNCTTTTGYCTDGSAKISWSSSSEPLSRRGVSSPSLLRDRNGEIKIVEVLTRGGALPRSITTPRKEKTTLHTSPSSSATGTGGSVHKPTTSLSPHRVRPPLSPRPNATANVSPSTDRGGVNSSSGDKQPAGFRRLQEENALLHKKIDLLRKKVQSMSAAAEQAQHAHLHLSPRGITPPTSVPATTIAPASPLVTDSNSSSTDEMKNMFLGIISSLRNTIEAQDATINGQDLLIKALTTSS